MHMYNSASRLRTVVYSFIDIIVCDDSVLQYMYKCVVRAVWFQFFYSYTMQYKRDVQFGMCPTINEVTIRVQFVCMYNAMCILRLY